MVANGTAAGPIAKARVYAQPTSFLTGRYPRTTRCRQNGQAMPPKNAFAGYGDAGSPAGSPANHLATCANGVVEKRIDDGYEVFHWSHHPQPDWPEMPTQWLTEQGTSWEELYDGPATPYDKHGIPAGYGSHLVRRHGHRVPARTTSNPFFSYNCCPHHPFDPPGDYRPATIRMNCLQNRPREPDGKTSYQQLGAQYAHNDPGGYPWPPCPTAASARSPRPITRWLNSSTKTSAA